MIMLEWENRGAQKSNASVGDIAFYGLTHSQSRWSAGKAEWLL